MQKPLTTTREIHRHDYTLVVGLGVTGLSVVRYLAGLGEKIIVVDSRDIPPELKRLHDDFPDIECHTGKFKPELFTSAQRIVLSPGVPLSEPAVRLAIDEGIEVSGDLDLFANVVSAPVIGITGSNGKSTVTTLLGEMARQAGINVAVGGNIGTPVLDLLQNNHELFVLELSSFQLETTDSLEPTVAAVLNLTPDHMDRYDSVEAYTAAKRRIFSGSGIMVLNADDPVVAQMARPDRSVIWFTLGRPLGENHYGVVEQGGRSWLSFRCSDNWSW